MKKLALAGLMAVVGTAAFASGYVEPIVEPEVVVAHSASSVGGIGLPRRLRRLAAAAAS